MSETTHESMMSENRKFGYEFRGMDKEIGLIDAPGTCRCCSTKNEKLLCATEVPGWMVREHIWTGYRPNLSSFGCMLSLFKIHNESGNIWSHAIGFGVVIYILVRHYFHEKTSWPSSDIITSSDLVIELYLIAAGVCLLLSTVYHMGNCCQDESTCILLLRGDVLGVAILIATSFLPGVYFGFACFASLQKSYLIVTGCLLILGLFVSLADCGHTVSKKQDENQHEYSKLSIEDKFKEDNSSAIRKLGRMVVIGSDKQSNDTHHLLNGESIVSTEGNWGNVDAHRVDQHLIFRHVIHRLRVFTFVGFACLGVVVAIHWAFLVASAARWMLLPKVPQSLSFLQHPLSF